MNLQFDNVGPKCRIYCDITSIFRPITHLTDSDHNEKLTVAELGKKLSFYKSTGLLSFPNN
jgi:hypothetical protein